MSNIDLNMKGKRFDKGKYEYNEITECQGWLTAEEKFINVFNRCIKDTVEDELADAVIRLFDLAGMRNISLELTTKDMADSIGYMAELCKYKTFTESIYAISTLVSRYDGLYDFPTAINDMITSIFGLAKYIDIDLLWHIEHKMKYNQFREKMHGKKY